MMTKTSAEPAFRGVITALITPFLHGEVDRKSFVRLLHQQLAQGVDGFVINGTTGESPTLQLKEVRTLFDIAKIEVGGQVPLIVGSGSNSTARACELTAEISRWQPAAVLVVVPYYNRPPQRGLVQHFTQVAHASQVPVLIYNVPSRTVTHLENATLLELSRVPHIVGVKDATANMQVLHQMRAALAPDFSLLSGDDLSAVEYCANGGHGVISVSSHLIGKEMKHLIQQARAENSSTTAEYQAKYGELMRCLYIEGNPIPVKMALYWMGVIESPELRLPLMPLDESLHKEFQTCLKNLAKI